MMRRNELLGLCTVAIRSVWALKTQGQPAWQLSAETIDPGLLGVTPIEWVHLPKSGTSFINSLIHIQGVCPGLPKDLRVSQERYGVTCNVLDHFFKFDNFTTNCNAKAIDLLEGRLRHGDIETYPPGGFEAAKGRFMTIMRQPEQRHISDFMAQSNQHDCHREVAPSPVTKKDILLHEGLVTKLLTRKMHEPMLPIQGMAVYFDSAPPTRTEVETAKSRLRTGFSFIGITEQWNMSICLFNKMFKQPCRLMQFASAHGGALNTYDTGFLDGWHDPYDTELYEVALEEFHANLKKYNVTEASCNLCMRDAEELPYGVAINSYETEGVAIDSYDASKERKRRRRKSHA